jgi:hypothetical protein
MMEAGNRGTTVFTNLNPRDPANGDDFHASSRPSTVVYSQEDLAASEGMPAPGGSDFTSEMNIFREILREEMRLEMEDFKNEFLQLLTKEVEIRERKIRVLESDLDLLKRQLIKK